MLMTDLKDDRPECGSIKLPIVVEHTLTKLGSENWQIINEFCRNLFFLSTEFWYQQMKLKKLYHTSRVELGIGILIKI